MRSDWRPSRRNVSSASSPIPSTGRIVTLRVMEHLQWEEIATLCGKTERTMRLRFEKARQRMREGVEAEAASVV